MTTCGCPAVGVGCCRLPVFDAVQGTTLPVQDGDVMDKAIVQGATQVSIETTPKRLIASYLTGRIELEFVPAAGSTRGHMVFVDLPPPATARLLLPALGGVLEIGFFASSDGSLMSTRSFSEVADGALLEFEVADISHRLVLQHMPDASEAQHDG